MLYHLKLSVIFVNTPLQLVTKQWVISDKLDHILVVHDKSCFHKEMLHHAAAVRVAAIRLAEKQHERCCMVWAHAQFVQEEVVCAWKQVAALCEDPGEVNDALGLRQLQKQRVRRRRAEKERKQVVQELEVFCLGGTKD